MLGNLGRQGRTSHGDTISSRCELYFPSIDCGFVAIECQHYPTASVSVQCGRGSVAVSGTPAPALRTAPHSRRHS